MRATKFLILTMFLSFNIVFAQENSVNDSYSPNLTGPYLGQKPPGSTAQVFAPGIVSTPLYELFSAFTPDMREFYFVRYDEEDKPFMIVYKYQNNQWQKSITGPRVGEPFISPDGKTMHLGRRYMERTDTGWSELKSLGAPYEDFSIMRLTASSKGTYFFDTAGEEPIRYSLLTDDKQGEPKTLSIDLGIHNAHPWIAPDESYLIWDDQREKGYGGADLYISFRKQDGSWGPSINLGDKINSERSDSYPTITPDGKYLLFNRNIDDNNVDIYWVEAKFIETLRPGQEDKESDFSFPDLEGPYMGQKPPGLMAEPFAPGIISKEGWEIEGVFAPGMKEFYFTTRSDKDSPITVIGFRQQDNIWKKYTEFRRRGEISFSPDGSRMHMAKGYKDRIGDGWSERKSLAPMFDREDWGIMRLTASSKGTYVFDDYKSGDVIRISTFKDGVRQTPKKMDSIVNTGEWTAHPFIAPDESYMIWDSEREGGYGGSDLYISFRQEDDSWGPAINMGDKVNSDKWDAYGSVTPDGKYITFNRAISDDYKNVDIYWVDAKIIEELRLE